MKVVYQAGSRNRFEDMDWEAQETVRRALAMVEGKTGFRTHRGEVWRDCQLEVTMGHNIYTTDIRIVPDVRERLGRSQYLNDSAYYCNGTFWATVSRTQVELI